MSAASSALADSFSVEINTTPLSGTQTIAFSLTDGDGIADNLIQLTNFSFGGGRPAGKPYLPGNGCFRKSGQWDQSEGQRFS